MESKQLLGKMSFFSFCSYSLWDLNERLRLNFKIASPFDLFWVSSLEPLAWLYIHRIVSQLWIHPHHHILTVRLQNKKHSQSQERKRGVAWSFLLSSHMSSCHPTFRRIICKIFIVFKFCIIWKTCIIARPCKLSKIAQLLQLTKKLIVFDCSHVSFYFSMAFGLLWC